MSERKERFTPGPWKTLHATHVLSSDNGYVARAYDSPLGPIANRYNATLIAAAPEMYEDERVNVTLLKSYLKLFEDFSRKAEESFCDAYFASVVDILRERIWKAEQLLAKARGEAQDG